MFLCARCASLHRKLGPEISEVRSLTLDKWYENDLDFLASIGNKRALQFWNPKKVPFPFDDDKDELYMYLRKKYVLGKFRYDAPTKEDYNLDNNGGGGGDGGSRHSHRDRFLSSSGRERSGSRSASSLPSLRHREVPEMERLQYRKLEPQLQDRGFRNNDENYEALSLARGDLALAVKILENSSSSEQNKPALPRRPGTSTVNNTGAQQQQQQPVGQASTSGWWNNNNSSSSVAAQTATATITASTQQQQQLPINPQTGLIEPPQQYLDPNTGVIYVDPVHQQQYLQEQEQLQLQLQLQLQQQQQMQQPAITGFGLQTQQPTGLNKNQLMSLYNNNNNNQQQQQFSAQFQQPQQTQMGYAQPTLAQQQVFMTGQFQQPQGQGQGQGQFGYQQQVGQFNYPQQQQQGFGFQ